MASLLRFDARLGEKMHAFGSREPFATVAEIFAISADEAVWFPLPLVLLVLGTVDTVAGCEFFGDVCFMAFSEQTFKFLFRRQRPSYAKQGTFYCLPGTFPCFPPFHRSCHAI